MSNSTKEKIEAAEQRIKELQLLIQHWKKQK
jgi:DNA polymerase sigma